MSELTGENRSNGRFEPGRSGNPAGRPKGARGHATLVADAMLEERVKAVVDNLIDRALAGSIPATRLALDRVSLSPPDRIALDLPTLRSPSDVVDASAVLVDAVAAGEVAPRAAKEMMAVLRAHLALLEAAASDAPDRAEPKAQADAAGEGAETAEVETEAAPDEVEDIHADLPQPIGNRRARRRSLALAMRTGTVPKAGSGARAKPPRPDPVTTAGAPG